MKKRSTVLLVNDDDTTNFFNELLLHKFGVAGTVLKPLAGDFCVDCPPIQEQGKGAHGCC